MNSKTKKILKLFLWAVIFIVMLVQGVYHCRHFSESLLHSAGAIIEFLICLYAIIYIISVAKEWKK